MLDSTVQNQPAGAGFKTADDGFVWHEVVVGDLSKGLILICDHACNGFPEKYGSLGLPPSELQRHIAYDIGVDGLTRQLAKKLGVPAVLTKFSRLLIDPNRGLDDPTLIMRLSDGFVVPGNAEIDDSERQHRIAAYYQPYHDEIASLIDEAFESGVVPALLSIHSFTPMWKGTPRPWHAGLLWDARDRRFSDAMVEALSADPYLVVGDNEPYRGGLPGDTVDVHGTHRGIASALLEVRQDLIGDDAGVAEWCARLAQILPGIIELPQLHEQLSS
ncbi:MAG: N-formylglutamate amidohydrolase [Rhizobiales bacterium]|nr:N-formylglutamate amidohydrolase [Hyphomicrobiales bacterium]